jgi:hypothetical protein
VRPSRTLALVALVALLPAAPVLATEAPLPEDRHFRVFLDDREVGDHRFAFAREGDAVSVHSQADFRVRIAFVTVYRYEHEARERWVDGCLVGLESTTNDNGTDHRVEASWHDGVFSVETNRGQRSVQTECPWTFAYWDPEIRERDELFNAQTGDRSDVSFTRLGERSLEIGGASRATRAWQLDAEKLDIVLHYSAEGRWLGLDSTLENGRTLRYRPAEDDPAHPGNGDDG